MVTDEQNKLLDSQDFYEVMQQYRHSDIRNQVEVVKAFENVKTWIRQNLLINVQEESNVHLSELGKKVTAEMMENFKKSIYSNVPEWLTPEVRKQVKETWDSHKDCDDGLRIKALRLVQETAKKSGYEIGIKKAMELMTEFCNIFN